MKGILVGLLAVIMTLPGLALAKQGKIDLKTVQQWQQKHAVVLTSPSGKEFCSGAVVGDKIMTAAHCCAAYVWAETTEGWGYSFDGVTSKPILTYHLDDRGNDICEITPLYPERSPIKRGETLYIDPINQIHERIMWVINKISYVYDDPSLSYMEVQKVYRISIYDEETQFVIVQGEAIPGTSGSVILNSRGEYIGNLVIGLGHEEGCCIEHVFGISLLELSEWGSTPH